MSTITETDLIRLHHNQQSWDKRQRFLAYSRQLDPRRQLARAVERHVRALIADRGYIVTKTSHTCNYDLLVQGIRIEVKAARWDGIRYEANLRSNDADALVFACIDSDIHFFVIPFGQVNGKTVIKITRHDPRDYIGQWMTYYDAWDILDDLVRAGRNPWQLDLFQPNVASGFSR